MIGVLASGTGSNLGALIQSDVREKISVIISNNPEAKALKRGAEANIPSVVIDHRRFSNRGEFDQTLANCLLEHGVEWVVLAGFMRIVGDPLLNAFPNRILNIHPALLPAYPGLHAQRQALEAGARVSGCTVHLVDAGVDTGPILAQAAIPVRAQDDVVSLSKRILRLEHILYPAVVRSVIDNGLNNVPEGSWGLEGVLSLSGDAPKDALFSPA